MAAGSSKEAKEISVPQAGLRANTDNADGNDSGNGTDSGEDDLLLARIVRLRSEIKPGREDFFNAICEKIERRQEELQRLLAEREKELRQLKKPRAAEAAEVRKAAFGQCAEKFLRVADALDEEIGASTSDSGKGMKDVRAQLREVFKSLGIEEFEPSPGDRYDSGCHAVWATGEETVRIKAGCIISSHQKGYRSRDGSLLREAGVTVAREAKPAQPDKPDACMGAYEHASRARQRARKGDIDGALAGYDRALAIEANPHTHAQRGEARAQKGDLSGAIADFEAAGRFANLSAAESRAFRSRAGTLRRRQARKAAPAGGGKAA